MAGSIWQGVYGREYTEGSIRQEVYGRVYTAGSIRKGVYGQNDLKHDSIVLVKGTIGVISKDSLFVI